MPPAEPSAEPAASPSDRRLRVLVSAFSCQPGGGSEAGVGWSWATAAAEHHDVWLLTDAANRDRIERAGESDPIPSMRPVYVEVPAVGGKLLKGNRGTYLRYVAWQRSAAAVAERLHREVGFDVAHHVSWATDFLPVGVARLRSVPLVLGPMGGISPFSPALWRWLGWRSVATRLVNEPLMRTMRRLFVLRTAKRAAVNLALSHAVAEWWDRRLPRPTIVEPHGALSPEDLAADTTPLPRVPKVAVFSGRIIGWKGLRIAIAALREPPAEGWRLEVLGEGPDRPAVEEYASRLGVRDRVEFRGWCPREDAATAVRRAHCMVHPALLDASPWAVAEAVCLGTPVICFEGLGPATLVRDRGGILVARDRKAPARIAAAMAEAPLGGSPREDWLWDRIPPLLVDVYAEAVARGPGPG